MRYFNTSDTAVLLNQVAAELVNITYGKTYFTDKYELLDTPAINHNSYTIDSVDYCVNPNSGFIHLFAPDAVITFLTNHLENKFREFAHAVLLKHKLLPFDIATFGTTQYMTITNSSNAQYTNVIKFASPSSVGLMAPVVPAHTHFMWNLVRCSIPVSDYTSGDPNAIYSLSSIVVDLLNMIDLPNGYRSPDYPRYTDYTQYKLNKFCDKVINFNINYGIHYEITKWYPSVTKPKKQTDLAGAKSKLPIRIVKWEWLNPYSITTDTGMNYIQQIEKGLFDTEPNGEVPDTCFITNAPLFTDCYVFDIIEQTINEIINEGELDEYKEKYIDLQILPLEPEVVPAAEEIAETKKPKMVKVKKTIKTKALKQTKTLKQVKTLKVAKKSDVDQDENLSKILEPEIRPVKAPIIRKGAAEPKTQIRISYTKKYDEPKCVLISPYYMHMLGIVKPIEQFEFETKTRVLVYRTYHPNSVEYVIEKSTASPVVKTVMLELDNNAEITAYNTIITPKISLQSGAIKDSSTLIKSDKVIGHFISI